MDRFYAPSNFYVQIFVDTPNFSWEKKEKGWITKKTFIFFKKVFIFYTKIFSSIIIFIRCNAFLNHSVPVSFPTKVISVGIPNRTPIPLFILVPVTLLLACNPGKRTNLFNVLLRKRGTCPTTSSRLK